jgi:NAD(P)-dependent dehydrogenase (short-subunit alcohol dehydrogenase family)
VDGRPDFESAAAPGGGGFPTALYARSKLANVLHTLALARRLDGTGVTANCVHPGIVDSNLLPWFVRIVKPLVRPVVFDCERGARSTLFAALAPQLAGLRGRYLDEHQQDVPPSAVARDVAVQERLWAFSEERVDRALPGLRGAVPWYRLPSPAPGA